MKTDKSQLLIHLATPFADFNHAMLGMMLTHADLPFTYDVSSVLESNIENMEFNTQFLVITPAGVLHVCLSEAPRPPIRMVETENGIVDLPPETLMCCGKIPIQLMYVGKNPKHVYEDFALLINTVSPKSDLLSYDDYESRVKRYFSCLRKHTEREQQRPAEEEHKKAG